MCKDIFDIHVNSKQLLLTSVFIQTLQFLQVGIESLYVSRYMSMYTNELACSIIESFFYVYKWIGLQY